MAITTQAKMVSPMLNRVLSATITASQTPLNDLSDMHDSRRGLATLFEATSVDIDCDLGPRGPYNINFASVFADSLSVAGRVVFKSKATVGAGYTTQQTIALFSPLTSDGADGFGADERGADEYPTPDVRQYPAHPPYYVLFATPIDHRYWRISITNDDDMISVSIPILAQMWEMPTTAAGLTDRVSRSIIDSSTKQQSLSGADTINPGVQHVQLSFSFALFEASEAWKTLAYWFEEHGTRDPYFVILQPPVSASNLSNTADTAGYEMLRTMLYGTFTDIPATDVLAGRGGTSTVDMVGFTILESV
jgi:hypothetical protein